MNNKQKVLCWISLGLFIISLLAMPTVRQYGGSSMSPLRNMPIWEIGSHDHIRFDILLLEWFGLVVISTVLWFLLKKESVAPLLEAVKDNVSATELIQNKVSNSEQIQKYKGVKGWLKFFCFTLLLFNPLPIGFRDAWASYVTFQEVGILDQYFGLKLMVYWEIIYNGFIAIYGLWIGLVLLSGNMNGKTHAVNYLKISSSIIFIGLFVDFLIMSTMPVELTKGVFDSSLLLNFIPQIIYVVIWLTYFHYSKRVRATYGVPS